MLERPFQKLWDLFATSEPACLGPERRESALTEDRVWSAVRDAFSGTPTSGANEELVLSLLLLWHDHLEASHALSQNIAGPDGSFVHALMHRREPDYWNSKYWWRQARRHAAFEEIGQRAQQYLTAMRVAVHQGALLGGGIWKPEVFVDACEAVVGRSASDSDVMNLRQLQRIEFEVLLGRFLHV